MIDIKSLIENEYLLMKVIGQVDASSSIFLDDEINKAIEENHKNILIDCTNLNYIASAGLGVFMSYIQDLKAKEITMVIFGLNEKVGSVFTMLGLDQLLTIVSDKEQAKTHVNAV